jgi:hypothetical protein
MILDKKLGVFFKMAIGTLKIIIRDRIKSKNIIFCEGKYTKKRCFFYGVLNYHKKTTLSFGHQRIKSLVFIV